jgi:signal transduction histidine kinase
MTPLGLRARLVAAFVGIAALTTLVAALLTSFGLHHQIDAYLEQRVDDAAASAVAIAETTYAKNGRWTPEGLDLLAHELILTGYDFRLVSRGRTLLDTTKLERTDSDFRRVADLPVRNRAGDGVGTLQLYALGPGGNMPADDQLRSELDRAHLLAAAIAARIAMIAGLVVAGRLSRPLQRLAEAARGIASGSTTPPPLPTGSREVRELGQALSGLAGDLDRQQRSRRQLAQDLSHELRTPLMLVQSRIEAMQDGVLPFDADGLSALHTETLRLGRLIGQIERLAEAEAHPPPLRRETISLDEVAREAHDALAAAFEIRGLSLATDTPPTPAKGDADAVRQIITNLLTNALKYAPDECDVLLSTSLDGDRALLRVSDGGRALGEVAGERVFERFYRGPDAAQKSGGAGLGLTIARNLAAAQGGGLAVESDHEGTRFTLWLPSGAAGGRTPNSSGETEVSVAGSAPAVSNDGPGATVATGPPRAPDMRRPND